MPNQSEYLQHKMDEKADSKYIVLGNGKSRLQFDLDELKSHTNETFIGCNNIYKDWSPDILVAVDVQVSAEIVKSGYTLNNVCYFKDWDCRVPYEYKESVLSTFPKTDYSHLVDFSKPEHKEVVITGLSAVREVTPLIMGEKGDLGFESTGDYTLFVVGVDENDKSKDLKTDGGIHEHEVTLEFAGPNAVHLAINKGAKQITLIGFDLENINGLINNVYAGDMWYIVKGGKENPKLAINSVNEMQYVMVKFPDVEFLHVSDGYTPKKWLSLPNVKRQSIFAYQKEKGLTIDESEV